MEIKVQELPFEQKSDEWLNIRSSYIGASEIGALLNIDEFYTVKDLLIKKIYNKNEKTNRTAIGSMLEDSILELFSYFDFDPVKTYENYINKNKVRNVQRINKSYLLYIDNVPFIVSPDGIVIHDDNSITPVEIKFISEMYSKKHIDNTGSGKYAWQSVFQQILTKAEYGYIFTLISNKDFVLDIVEKEKFLPLIHVVLDKAKEFYDNLEKCKNMTMQEIITTIYPDVPLMTTPVTNDSSPIQINEHNDNNGDEEDERYAQMYTEMTLQENEIRKNKEHIKNYFIYKYGGHAIIKTDTFVITTNKPFKIKMR